MHFDYDINKLITQHATSKILVVGDAMLDQYWFGKVERISPEAPVPIAQIHQSEERPGGAANVAYNIANLKTKVSLLSIVGNDDAAKNLSNLLQSLGVTTLFIEDTTIKTTLKLRILSKNQQLMRVDFEHLPSKDALQQLLNRFKQIVQEFDIIVFSDYGKGVLDNIPLMIKLAKGFGKTVLIDPKGKDYTRYSGADLITPNKAELHLALGKMWQDESQLAQYVAKLQSELNIPNLLLTRSEEGMTLYGGNSPHNYPTKAKEVYDVSGAGDTVIATLAVMLKAGMDLSVAVYLANLAAGIVVAKVGTAAISIAELTEAINSNE